VGAGFGLSAGQLSDANIQVGNTQLTGKSSDGAFAYQFLGGVRAYVTKKIFLFGEYKYLAANYKWESQGINTGNPVVKYDFRTQIISSGIGISF
jgi:opacity protein-like surface antigen